MHARHDEHLRQARPPPGSGACFWGGTGCGDLEALQCTPVMTSTCDKQGHLLAQVRVLRASVLGACGDVEALQCTKRLRQARPPPGSGACVARQRVGGARGPGGAAVHEAPATSKATTSWLRCGAICLDTPGPPGYGARRTMRQAEAPSPAWLIRHARAAWDRTPRAPLRCVVSCMAQNPESGLALGFMGEYHRHVWHCIDGEEESSDPAPAPAPGSEQQQQQQQVLWPPGAAQAGTPAAPAEQPPAPPPPQQQPQLVLWPPGTVHGEQQHQHQQQSLPHENHHFEASGQQQPSQQHQPHSHQQAGAASAAPTSSTDGPVQGEGTPPPRSESPHRGHSHGARGPPAAPPGLGLGKQGGVAERAPPLRYNYLLDLFGSQVRVLLDALNPRPSPTHAHGACARL